LKIHTSLLSNPESNVPTPRSPSILWATAGKQGAGMRAARRVVEAVARDAATRPPAASVAASLGRERSTTAHSTAQLMEAGSPLHINAGRGTSSLHLGLHSHQRLRLLSSCMPCPAHCAVAMHLSVLQPRRRASLCCHSLPGLSARTTPPKHDDSLTRVDWG
jgi:hypothetical protein